MRTLLKIFFSFVIIALFAGTAEAVMDRGIWTALRGLWPDPWFRVTLYDAYFAFLTVWLWIAYKESSWFKRGFWFVLIMLLGNFAIASYMLMQLFRLKKEEPLSRIFVNPKSF